MANHERNASARERALRAAMAATLGVTMSACATSHTPDVDTGPRAEPAARSWLA